MNKAVKFFALYLALYVVFLIAANIFHFMFLYFTALVAYNAAEYILNYRTKPKSEEPKYDQFDKRVW